MASFFDNRARSAAAKAAFKPKSDATKHIQANQPWVEKYRPKSLQDVAAQDHTIRVLQRTLQATNLPHMLFYGPPGTGKTSTVLALAKELFGPEMFRSRVLELNASDERGISIVREKVKDFARMQLSHPPAHYTDRYPCPPYKIIILDEADSMTQDAQSALRRTMETYSKITRFCLICNYVTRIIDPLASRCSKFRFKILDQGDARQRLVHVAESENLDVDGAVIEALLRCSEGDMRRAITFMQSASRFLNAAPIEDVAGDTVKKRKRDKDAMDLSEPVDGAITVNTIEEIAGIMPKATLQSLLEAIKPKTGKAVYQDIADQVANIVADGWSASQVVLQLHQVLALDDTIPNAEKAKIFMQLSDCDKRLCDGADEHLTMLDLVLQISQALRT